MATTKTKPKYINRELSWLDFNARVLYQTLHKTNPLLERTKFLGITANNLDEFVMVRVSSILNKVKSEKDSKELSGMNPQYELKRVLRKLMDFKKYQSKAYETILKELSDQKIRFANAEELTKNYKKQTEALFEEIYPFITPIAYDQTTDFPFIHSSQLVIVVMVWDDERQKEILSVIPIEHVNRVNVIEETDKSTRLALVEDIIRCNIDKLFIHKEVRYMGTMRILRSADIELEHDENIFIVDRMKKVLTKREKSQPVLLEVNEDIPKTLLKSIQTIYEVPNKQVYKSKDVIDYRFLMNLPVNNPKLYYKGYKAKSDAIFMAPTKNIFSTLDARGDVIFHHPYDSFTNVARFINTAAIDPNVVAVRQTLYRVSSEDSPIIESLCSAARKGKQVSVLIELKARFDEDQNIGLIEKLKQAGCMVIYGIETLKTHCKFSLIVRKTKKGVRLYSHIGTGNYNDKTSNIYTDISYITSNQKIGRDLITIFNILSGVSSPKREIEKLYFSPYNIRSKLYKLIDDEIRNAKKGKEASIVLKLNSISDKEMIDKLYEASEKGVKITLVVRGICSMKPINKNIQIRSFIGRYLEHSRIYEFHNDGNPQVFISSADLLTRNLDRRVELMVPIKTTTSKQKIHDILDKYLSSKVSVYKMDKDGGFKFYEKKEDVQENFMKGK